MMKIAVRENNTVAIRGNFCRRGGKGYRAETQRLIQIGDPLPNLTDWRNG